VIIVVKRECNFCGTEVEPGTGMVWIRRDGAIINFCSRKCRINMVKLKRVPRKVKWTREYQNLKNIRKASETHKEATKLGNKQ
jgi:large subunit ribosomal protein L24e